MNEDFLRPFITDKMQKPSFQMLHFKALGPDERIYSWDVIKHGAFTC